MASFGFHGDFLPAMARPPSALVRRFMQRDAVHPSAQTRFAMEPANTAKNLNEDVLSHVSSISRIRQHARDDAIDWLVVSRNQPCKGLFRASFKLRDDIRLFRPDCNNACQISHYRSCLHLGIILLQ